MTSALRARQLAEASGLSNPHRSSPIYIPLEYLLGPIEAHVGPVGTISGSQSRFGREPPAAAILGRHPVKTNS